MQRILVTGNAGSGKTTLSLRLGETLKLPVVHMDQVVWGPGWRSIEKDEIREQMTKRLKATSWIVDGVSTQASLHADTIVFLDFPVYLCLFRALKRTVHHLRSARPELPPNCSEIRITWRLIKLVLHFHQTTRHKILEYLKQEVINQRVFHIRYQEDLDQFINSISREMR